MKMFKTLVMLSLFAGLIFNCAAEEKTPKSITETFFNTLKTGNTVKAFKQLFVDSKIPASKPQAVDMLIRQTNSGLPMYGKNLGFELISEDKFGSSVVKLVYLLKFERHPIVWEFFFYKPYSKWFLANVRYNDQLNTLK